MATAASRFGHSWRSRFGVFTLSAALVVSMAAGVQASGHGSSGHDDGHTSGGSGAEPDGGGHGAAAPSSEDFESATGVSGIKIGEFDIRTSRAAPSQKHRVKFALYAKVSNDQFQMSRTRVNHERNKIREQVIVATRLVPPEDYDDPELKKLRRRIQLRLRRMLPEFQIEEILVSDFDVTVESP